jgi:predicted nucleic acid-binding Zn ribbon protein
MPSYIYKCVNQDCSEFEKEFKVQKKMSEPSPSCANCDKEVSQVFTNPVNFRLKGNGWTRSNISG